MTRAELIVNLILKQKDFIKEQLEVLKTDNFPVEENNEEERFSTRKYEEIFITREKIENIKQVIKDEIKKVDNYYSGVEDIVKDYMGSMDMRFNAIEKRLEELEKKAKEFEAYMGMFNCGGYHD